MNRIRPILFVAAFLFAGCSDATGPSDQLLFGVFQLETVDGDAPPATIFDAHVDDGQGGFTLRVEVIGGSIDFYGDQEYEQLVERRGFADGEPIALGSFIDRGFWVNGPGDEIVLQSELYENRTTFGTHTNGVVSLEQDLSGEDRVGGQVSYRFEAID